MLKRFYFLFSIFLLDVYKDIKLKNRIEVVISLIIEYIVILIFNGVFFILFIIVICLLKLLVNVMFVLK